MKFHVLKAIFKRDFISYFSNPTGYVFICVFVVLSSLAAFWPPEFFGNNLANLDQLSKWLPFVMLVFIPAITMSIWAEERRQSTDELLLTIPASDWDVVAGKYLAAVAIFTVSLLFSMFSIYLVFSWGLGSPDPGLFIGSYVGYWFIGIAMLSIGMVASFLTANLTVGFILGMLFNLPLALFGVADWIIKNPWLAETIKRWSAVEQFRDFERGVISLAGISYFLMIAVVMLYVSMVLIARRHWGAGDDGDTMWGHYLVRAIALLVFAVGVNVLFSNYNLLRWDISSGNLNSLSIRTVRLIRELEQDGVAPIKIDAYVSPQVPAEYASQKLNLISTLDELRALSGGKIEVDVHTIENFSEQATRAERAYGIESQQVATNTSGTRSRQEIFLGAVFRCGLDKVVLPFIDKGIPVEYELVRSICTVAQQKRQRVGVLKTDAQLFGGFTMQGPIDEARIITELKKQYDVVEIDPSKPISERYDVLLAVQPSSLSPEAMDNFVAAVKTGQPTAIFEDPFPWPEFYGNLAGTAQPRSPSGGMNMFSRGQPQPKGDIGQLWKLLGVHMDGDQLIWQEYNPEPRAGDIPPLWIFIDKGNGAVAPFNPDDPLSAGMKQALFLMAGSFAPDDKSPLKFTELAVTGTNTGTVSYFDYEMVRRANSALALRRIPTREPYVVAARVNGTIQLDDELTELESKPQDAADTSETTDGEESSTQRQDDAIDVKLTESEINVVLVADVDWIAPIIFLLREMGQQEDSLVDWKFQNVTFVLNILDDLAGDDRFIALRKRTRPHRILTKIEDATLAYREQRIKDVNTFVGEARRQTEAAQQEFDDKIAEIEKRTELDPRAKDQLLARERSRLTRIRNVKIAGLERERDRQIKLADRELAAKIRAVQDRYKLYAVILPPIPPILLAFFVFFHRRQAEREGVEASRLRYGGADRQTKHELRESA